MTLATSALRVGYDGRPLVAVDDLAFAAGTVTAILGPNGAGKSTLLRTLAGLLPPISGDVRLEGRLLAAISRSERAREIAFLAQEENPAFPMTVRESVAIGRLPHSIGLRESPADHAAIARAIARVDLPNEADTLLERLSGGQRRRATIARALAQEAGILLLDEPLAHLDPAHADEVLGTLYELRALGRTVVATFHEVDAALAVADRVLLLAAGAVAYGGPAASLSDEILEQAYGVPFARFTSGDRTVRRPLWHVRGPST